MKTLCVLQHVEADYLGLMEDHFESRNIRFHYCRPFTSGGRVPQEATGFDGLIILGAGPLGIVSGDPLPSLAAELRLAGEFLRLGLPVIGIGLGAVLLAVAAGGSAEEAPLRFEVTTARRISAGALAGHLPDEFPSAVYMRDRPVLPAGARILAVGASDEALVFQIGDNCVGFLGHPGIKSAMIEDLIMEFDEAPDGTAETLERLRSMQAEIAAGLTQIIVGLIKMTDWMEA
jgi:GMP synthase-like glutamine amidotransferase